MRSCYTLRPPSVSSWVGVCLWAATFALPASSSAEASEAKSDARAIHSSALIIDTHADTPQRFLDEGFDIGTVTPVAEGHMDLEKIRVGNLGAEFFSIWVEPKRHPGRFAHRALQLIDSVYQQVARHPNEMMMAFTSDDIINTTGSKWAQCG